MLVDDIEGGRALGQSIFQPHCLLTSGRVAIWVLRFRVDDEEMGVRYCPIVVALVARQREVGEVVGKLRIIVVIVIANCRPEFVDG